MNKSLIALRKLLNDWESMSVDERCECHNLIEEELSTIEEIEEHYGIPQIREICLLLIQFEIKDASVMTKKLKSLEIIKEKQVNVGVLIHHITDKHLLGLESYNFMWGGTPECQLTQEEFDLLKEVLCDD